MSGRGDDSTADFEMVRVAMADAVPTGLPKEVKIPKSAMSDTAV